MKRVIEPTAEQEAAWKEFVASRPPKVRAAAERFDPWTLYRMKSTGDRVTLHAFSESKEDGSVTVTVNITAAFNLCLFERQVFGVDPDDLEPCEPPAPAEPVGALMTSEQVDANIDDLRVAVRPDLWTMGPDGKAYRKN